MKLRYIIGMLCMTALFTQCKKESIKMYDAGHYIQFTRSDTTTLSFFFYPGQSQVDIAMPVQLIGKMPDADLHYKIQVAAGATTATPDHYAVPTDFVFRKGRPIDTAHLTIINRPDLASKTMQLTIQIVAGDGILPGQTGFASHVFMINDMVSQPVWWDATVVSKYLGVYTEKKFRTFMAATGVGDISSYSSFEQRDLMLQFKYYLIAMKDAGTPVLEDDGTDMLSTVPLIG